MNWRRELKPWALAALACLALVSGQVKADTVTIDDLTDTLTVTNTGGTISSLVITGELVTFDFTSDDFLNNNTSVSQSLDFLEADGTLSDRLFVNTTGNNAAGFQTFHVIFGSDPTDLTTIPKGNTFQGSATEDGTPQGLVFSGLTGADSFLAQSEVDPVPELDPGGVAGALTVLVGGVLTLRGRRRRR
jgi:hypothetical protein